MTLLTPLTPILFKIWTGDFDRSGRRQPRHRWFRGAGPRYVGRDDDEGYAPRVPTATRPSQSNEGRPVVQRRKGL